MGTVIGVFSAKGGVGKTLLATNLAAACGVGHHKKTVLVDLNIGNGATDLLLDLNPERFWSDLGSVFQELTPQHLSLTITEYRPDLDLLASPPDLTKTEVIKMEDLSLLFNALKKVYDLIVLDTPIGIDPPVRGCLALAEIKLMVLTPDAPTLRSTSRFLTALPNPKKMNGLIINQYSPAAAITPEEIKDLLGQPVFGVLPIDQAGVWANVSYGEPCVFRKSSKLGRSIRQISGRLLRFIDHGPENNSNDDDD